MNSKKNNARARAFDPAQPRPCPRIGNPHHLFILFDHTAPPVPTCEEHATQVEDETVLPCCLVCPQLVQEWTPPQEPSMIQLLISHSAWDTSCAKSDTLAFGRRRKQLCTLCPPRAFLCSGEARVLFPACGCTRIALAAGSSAMAAQLRVSQPNTNTRLRNNGGAADWRAVALSSLSFKLVAYFLVCPRLPLSPGRSPTTRAGLRSPAFLCVQ